MKRYVKLNWQQEAKLLPYSTNRKILHCGSSAAARISNSNAGISLHCFRCGAHLFEPHGERSAAEILQARRATEELRAARFIPERCQWLNDPSVPAAARIWTLKAGLMPDLASSRYGMRYDPKTRRVCVPLIGGFIARAVFSGDSPKYIRSGTMDQTVYQLDGWYGNRPDTVVVVEDILSAIKVSRSGFNALAILGTSVSEGAAMAMGEYNHVVVWTDGDKAGDAAYKKIKGKLALFDTDVSRIRTDDDPKNLNAFNIQQLMEVTQ